MLRMLLVYITLIIGIVCCQDCPDFGAVKNDVTLKNYLNGSFYVTYTSANILECERCTWTVGSNNEITAYVESSSGCCMQIDNFVSSDEAHYQYTVTPVKAGCNGTVSAEVAYMKLVATTKTGDVTCLTISICRATRNGLLVMCSQKPQLSLLSITQVILNLIFGLISPAPKLKAVSQSNCIFGNTCTA